jgi:ribosomal protein S18 acetylase RimI-like enzyme
MVIELTDVPIAALAEYARIPIVFTVDRVLDVTTVDRDRDRFGLSERRLQLPYEKDYDAAAGGGPQQWSRRFDLSTWAFFMARTADRVVGGAAVAFDTPDLSDGRGDVAALWDIRVAPDARRQGIGAALLHRIEASTRRRGRRQLKVETQNTNVQACRFYERQGYRLQAIHRAAYSEFPQEIELLWYKDVGV